MRVRTHTKVRHSKAEQRLKTVNGFRQVDLHPTIAGLLTVRWRLKGWFPLLHSKGKTRLTHEHHPAPSAQGTEGAEVNPFTGTHRAGNHAFRRFRNTYLRNYTECPEGLYKYWMGHAGKDMSDLYDKIKEDVPFRRQWAERCGFGFELPSVVPNVPKTT